MASETVKQQGFTLIEILVALFIFAILSVIVSVGLDSVLNTHRRVMQVQTQLDALLKAETLLRRDVMQMIALPGIDLQGRPIPPVKSLSNGFSLARSGVMNPYDRQARSDLRRVTYLIHHHHLIRRVSRQSLDILHHVVLFHIQYLDRANHYYDTWPLPYGSNAQRMNASPLPKAVVVTLRLAHQGEWHWIIPVLGGMHVG